MGKYSGYSPPQQCSCLGGNPNCFKCGGWGYIDAISAGRISAGPVGAPLNRNWGGRPGKKGQQGKGSQKIKPAQQPKMILMPKPVEMKQPIKLAQKGLCPHCGVRFAQLHQHILKTHTGQFTLPHKKKKNLCICSACKALVKESNLSQHMRRIHGGAKVIKRLTRPKWPTLHLPEPSCQGDENQRGFDATRDYAHNFRDHGQFGSHPSHDGFDDESNP